MNGCIVKCDSCGLENFKSMQYEHDKMGGSHNATSTTSSSLSRLKLQAQSQLFKSSPNRKSYNPEKNRKICIQCYQKCFSCKKYSEKCNYQIKYNRDDPRFLCYMCYSIDNMKKQYQFLIVFLLKWQQR